MDRVAFFENWSRESAWVYGLILGDGHVALRKEYGLVQLCGNKDTIWKFQALMGIPETRAVFKRGVWHTAVGDRNLASWFRQRGIMAKKSTAMVWPKDIPKSLIWDFVRGLVDTDGTVTFVDRRKYGGRGRVNFSFGFTSATLSFAERFRDQLGSDRAITESRKQMKSGMKFCYGFRLGMEDSIKACRRFYRDAPQHIRNEERYDRYLQGEALWTEYSKGCQVRGPRGGLCGQPIHTGDICTEHMWEAKIAARPDRFCEGCGCQIPTEHFCSPCKYRSLRLLKNPSLRPRARRG